MEKTESKEEQLLEQIEKLFMRYGVRSLTMDDIARELGISKKTIYLHFEDKADLVKKGMASHFVREEKKMQCVFQDSKNAIDELFNITSCVRENIKSVQPSIMYDLQKYYPEAWKQFNTHKFGFILNSISNNLKRGIEEGYYRAEINVDVVSKLYVSRIEIIFDQDFFPSDKYNLLDVHFEMVSYHLYAICSSKGLKYLEKKIQTFVK